MIELSTSLTSYSIYSNLASTPPCHWKLLINIVNSLHIARLNGCSLDFILPKLLAGSTSWKKVFSVGVLDAAITWSVSYYNHCYSVCFSSFSYLVPSKNWALFCFLHYKLIFLVISALSMHKMLAAPKLISQSRHFLQFCIQISSCLFDIASLHECLKLMFETKLNL